MRFTPLTPARLVHELADWARGIAEQGPPVGDRRACVIGFDGPPELGTALLADEVGQALRAVGVAAVRASTSWWWRPSALRLELGRQDEDMLLTGWVDSGALRRELLVPIRAGGWYLTRLRDPDTDRSVRQQPEPGQANEILLLDGPFLLAAELPLDALVSLDVSQGALLRALPPERSWWVPAYQRYQRDYRPGGVADVVLAYDHPSAPAVAGLSSPAGFT